MASVRVALSVLGSHGRCVQPLSTVREGCGFAASLPALVTVAVPVCAKRRLVVPWPEEAKVAEVLTGCRGAGPPAGEQEQGQEVSWRRQVSGA